MNEFLKMDIFFVVATCAVVVLAVFAAFVLWRLERVLKQIEHISEQVALESDTIRADLADLRSDIKEGKGRAKSLFHFLGTLIKTKKRSARK